MSKPIYLFGRTLNGIFCGKYWRKLIFCLLINLGLPATFGFYGMSEVPLRTRLGVAIIMIFLSVFEACVMWPDLVPEKDEDLPNDISREHDEDEECACENCFCNWMRLVSAELAEIP